MSVNVSHVVFATIATIVNVSHVQFDTRAPTTDVRVSWAKFDIAYIENSNYLIRSRRLFRR
jgi:hypothetical protein